MRLTLSYFLFLSSISLLLAEIPFDNFGATFLSLFALSHNLDPTPIPHPRPVRFRGHSKPANQYTSSTLEKAWSNCSPDLRNNRNRWVSMCGLDRVTNQEYIIMAFNYKACVVTYWRCGILVNNTLEVEYCIRDDQALVPTTCIPSRICSLRTTASVDT